MSAIAGAVSGDLPAAGEGLTPKALWTLAITSVAVFMVTLDNLVVTTAIPVIRQDLHAGLSGLQWTVNAYTLTFAVLLLTGAALGDRFGRRRLLAIGVGIFTAASAGAALAPSIVALDVARALQGVGGARVREQPHHPFENLFEVERGADRRDDFAEKVLLDDWRLLPGTDLNILRPRRREWKGRRCP